MTSSAMRARVPGRLCKRLLCSLFGVALWATPAMSTAVPVVLSTEFGWTDMEFGEGPAYLLLSDSWRVSLYGAPDAHLDDVSVEFEWDGHLRRRVTDASGHSTYTFKPGPWALWVTWTDPASGVWQRGAIRGRLAGLTFTLDEQDLLQGYEGPVVEWPAAGRGRVDVNLASFLGVGRKASHVWLWFLMDVIHGAPGDDRWMHSGCCAYADVLMERTDVPSPSVGLQWVAAAAGGLLMAWVRRPRS